MTQPEYWIAVYKTTPSSPPASSRSPAPTRRTGQVTQETSMKSHSTNQWPTIVMPNIKQHIPETRVK
ncbi:hypothetical protein J6590_009090 [Homalodisca vitripennis]|nr:hypothetical protein J6590_009090 [Homalodisca vitripennis]